MAQHEIAPATLSQSHKVLWLAALDALEEEFLAFQKRIAHADHLKPPSTANVLWHPASDVE
jgi:hypothetical protein